MEREHADVSAEGSAVRAAETAYAHLRGRILTGEISPGERILESEVAAQASISRTPVREALRRLDAEGLVHVVPNRGARVAGFDEQERAEILELRCLLEPFAAGRAAAHATTAQVAGLRHTSCEMRRLVAEREDGWSQELASLNRDFHASIVAAAGNHRLVALANRLMEPGLISLTFSGYSEEQLERSMRHHDEVVVAIAAGNASWASAVMTAHLTAASNVSLT